MLSVVIPAYNEEENIKEAGAVISGILDREKIEHELIFIDDGSRDKTFKEIQELHTVKSNIRGIRFSRNFGKESAILAGLNEVKGDCAAVIDCDLQHPPETLVQMYRLWEEGYEVVEGVKSSRGREGFFYKCCSGVFYHFMGRAVGFDMSTSSDFKLMSKRVTDIIAGLPESNIFFRAQTYWVGFKTTSVEYDVNERERGTTKWSPIQLFKYALHNLISFTTAPLQLITSIGILLMILFFGVGIEALVSYFMGESAQGMTTVILLLLLIGGSVMISLGMIGLYIGEIYKEVKKRPVYLIQERLDS